MLQSTDDFAKDEVLPFDIRISLPGIELVDIQPCSKTFPYKTTPHPTRTHIDPCMHVSAKSSSGVCVQAQAGVCVVLLRMEWVCVNGMGVCGATTPSHDVSNLVLPFLKIDSDVQPASPSDTRLPVLHSQDGLPKSHMLHVLLCHDLGGPESVRIKPCTKRVPKRVVQHPRYHL